MRKTVVPDLASAIRPAIPEKAEPTRLSLREAWSLLREPSSEEGVQRYYRALLGRPPEADTLTQALEALRLGDVMRVDLLASIALSDEARSSRRRGPGTWLIRAVNSLTQRSGLGRRIRTRRATVAAAETAATRRSLSAATGMDAASSALARRVVMLEGGLRRLENTVFALQRDRVLAEDRQRLEARVGQLETTLIGFLQATGAEQPAESRPQD